jgi:hypothetical protein
VPEQLGRLAEAQHSAPQHGTYGVSDQDQAGCVTGMAATGIPRDVGSSRATCQCKSAVSRGGVVVAERRTGSLSTAAQRIS